ncbi:MAG: FAD-dependent oxidoreductase [bacterium]|nr:FAD-dependent oxidoreductase [bacterium]
MADERRAVLEAVHDHGHDTRSLVFRPDVPFAFRPGQFLSCLIPAGAQRLVRPYTIASSPEEPERLELLLNRVPHGPGSTWLFARRPGDALAFTGPWGTFVLDAAPDAEAVFLAQDTGIAAIRPMLCRALATARHPLRLVCAADHPIYRDELTRLAGIDTSFVPTDALEPTVAARYLDADEDRTRHFFICGVGAVVTRLRDRLRAAGYARRAVQYEKW